MSQSVNSEYTLSDGFFGMQILQNSVLAGVRNGPSWRSSRCSPDPQSVGKGYTWTLKNVTNFAVFGRFELQSLQLHEASPPDLLTRGHAPGSRWRLRLQTPVIRLHSALVMVPCLWLTLPDADSYKNAPTVALNIHFEVRHLVSWKLHNLCNLHIVARKLHVAVILAKWHVGLNFKL